MFVGMEPNPLSCSSREATRVQLLIFWWINCQNVKISDKKMELLTDILDVVEITFAAAELLERRDDPKIAYTCAFPKPCTFLKEKPDPKLETSSSYGTSCYCGQRYVRKLQGSGTFLCTVCNQPEFYQRKKLMIYKHWNWIIVWDGDNVDEYIKCATCENHFYVTVLDWARGPELAKKALARAMIEAMILFMLAKGHDVNALESAKICQIYQKVSNTTTVNEKITVAPFEELKSVTKRGLMLYFRELAYHLTQDHRDMIFKAVAHVALADGHDLKDKGDPLLFQIGDSLCANVSRVQESMRTQNPCPSDSHMIKDKPAVKETRCMISVDV